MIGWFFVGFALLVAGAVAVQAARRPILFRMALRNAMRRPKQTATVIAGLMIGTAIISAALVAGTSATSAIRGAVYDALGPVDETVRMDAFHFYPEMVLHEFEADPQSAWFDGIAPNIIWDAAADNPRTDLFEPSVNLIGFDRSRDVDFGDFEFGDRRSDGSSLADGDVYVTQKLADALEIAVGDNIQLAYTQPFDPLLPTFKQFGGVLGTAIEPGLILPTSLPTNLLGQDTWRFAVPDGATQLSLILFCGDPESGPTTACPPGTTLRLNAIAPDGTLYTERHALPQDRTCATAACPPENPLVLNVTAFDGNVLPGGIWDLEVRGEISTQTPYGLLAVALEPVYDLEELKARADALAEGTPFDDLLDGTEFGERQERTLRVADITTGGRGDQFDLDQAVFLPIETLQDMLGREGQINYLKFSNPGGTTDGADQTTAGMQRLNATLLAVQGQHPDNAAIQALEARPVKQNFLQIADDAGQMMTGLMIFAGSLSIITGLLLIINIFTMLAEERRSELGMARAVGLSRRDLVRLFLFEGSLYAVAAAFIGALVGLLLAFGMIAGLNAIVAGQGGDFPPIPFSPGRDSVPIAFAAGALLTFATIFIASRRQSRLNIVRAIRQIEDPDKSGSRWLVFVGAPLAALGLTLATIGWLINQFSLQVFGPMVLAAGLMMSLRPFWRRKTVDMSVAGGLAVYYATMIFLITEFENINEANIVGPIRGVTLTLCIVVLAANWQTGPRLLGRAMSRFKRLRAVALPAFSYPQHKRFRTGMTLAMFSIVILSVGFFTIFGGLFDVDPARHTGGFDVEATTTLRVDDLASYDQGLVDDALIASVHHVADYRSVDASLITVSDERTGHFGPPVHHVYGIDAAWVEAQEFRLLWTLDDLGEDATYQRLLTEPNTVIVGYTYSTNERGQDLSHEVGEMLQLNLGNEVLEYTIIGIQEQYHFPGIWLPKDTVTSLFPQTDDLFLYNLAPGADAETVAKDLERNYREVGMDAEASQQLVADEQEAFRQILGAMKVFLGLGLIVGVLSLGIITSRSVLERRQEIGMMRALGFTGRQVRRIFFIEVTFIIIVGALIGLLSSILVTYGLWFAIIRELQYPYVIPWGEIGLMLSVAYAVALLATAAPILRAAKVAPAEALRYIE